MADITVLTLNSWKGDGDYPKRLELIRHGIATLRPDICLLQESLAAGALGWDTAEHLAEALGYRLAFAPARDKKRLIDGHPVVSQSGLALLTRGRIGTGRTVPLPDAPEDGERIAQIVEVTLAGARLLVVNIHLTYLPGRDELRQAELAAALAALPPLVGYDAAILGGDFNCPPDSAPIRWLLSEPDRAVTDTAAGAGFITHEASSSRPAQRIDYIFLIDAGRPARAIETIRVLDAPDPETGLLPSDHYGVLSRIRIGE
jgi:endonuclease/exonuclease/phosphatase family metal-dependent hydrolase